jgi:hypothetical protein
LQGSSWQRNVRKRRGLIRLVSYVIVTASMYYSTGRGAIRRSYGFSLAILHFVILKRKAREETNTLFTNASSTILTPLRRFRDPCTYIHVLSLTRRAEDWGSQYHTQQPTITRHLSLSGGRRPEQWDSYSETQFFLFFHWQLQPSASAVWGLGKKLGAQRKFLLLKKNWGTWEAPKVKKGLGSFLVWEISRYSFSFSFFFFFTLHAF